MTGSRARRLGTGAAALLAALLVASAARAQQPAAGSPPDAAAAEPPAPGAPQGPPLRLGLRAAPALAPTAPAMPGAAATPDARATQDVAGRLIARLPGGTPSPTLRALAARALAAADLPAATMPARVRALTALGLPDEALILARGAGPHADLGAGRRDAALLAGRIDEACAPPPEAASAVPELVLLCQVQAGRPEAAEVTLALLREQGADPAFLKLAEAATGGPSDPVDSLPGADPVRLVLLAAAKLPVPADAEAGADAGRLGAIARDTAAPPALRAARAERAARLGALHAEGLARTYRSLPPGPPPDDLPAGASDAARRAVAFQAATGASGPEIAELVAGALDSLDPVDLPGAVGEAWAGILPDPEPRHAPLAAAAARLRLARGEIDGAAPWLDLLGRHDPKAAARLWPLGMIAEATPLAGAEIGLSAWLDGASGTARGRRQAGALLALFEALGETVPEGAWAAVLDEGPGSAGGREAGTEAGIGIEMAPVPPAGLLHRLRAAALAGDRDGTALAALAVLGDAAPGRVPAAVLAPVIQAMRNAGAGTEARALAREAAAVLVGMED
ncbi:hypothetical protein [Arenibaculum pallidiluteum]|uniref:hypothetical protein n=1 Tax=Arenibaculum pallidiluteum TaxID=2812559 RepID=UPI001A970316|nr:hypothetical protein [Arenibaculum pallidiluteum]